MAAAERFVSFPLSPDRLGIWASAACFVHCLLSPILVSLSIVSAHLLPSEEHTHRALAVLITLLGTVALVRGLRRHRRWRVLVLMLIGLVILTGTAWFGDLLASHTQEVLLTLLGSCFMIVAHKLNHTFCHQCDCARPNPIPFKL